MEAVDRPNWNPARRCTATNNRGDRCWRQPIPGGHVCVNHGGAAPQVKQSAKMRLLEGADVAIDYLLRLLEPSPPCEHCGRSDADRDPVVVRACQIVLDRSGFHPTVALAVQQPENPYERMSLEQIAVKAEEMARTAREAADAEARRMLPASIDGEVLDAGFEVPDAAIQDGGVHVPLESETPDAGITETPKQNSDD